MITDRDIREALVRKGWVVPETEEEVRWAQESEGASAEAESNPGGLQELLDRFGAELDDESGSASTPSDSSSKFRGDLGNPQATEDSNHSHTLVGLAKAQTGQRPTSIAASVNATVQFLDYVNDFAEEVPEPVRVQLVESFHEQFGVSEVATRHAMMNNRPRQQMAASRDEVYTHSAPTFEKILRESSLSDDQIEYWRDLANL